MGGDHEGRRVLRRGFPGRRQRVAGRAAPIEPLRRGSTTPGAVEDLARDPGALPASAMTRDQLEHLIRAAAVIADDDTIVVVGSQAILGQFPNAPEPMRVSME